jgi:hypothetical protein
VGNNQAEALASGTQSAATVNPPKMEATFSHLGPNSTIVSGWESARIKPVKKHPINAMIS